MKSFFCPFSGDYFCYTKLDEVYEQIKKKKKTVVQKAVLQHSKPEFLKLFFLKNYQSKNI